MCKVVTYGSDYVGHEHITIEFQRRAELRATEVFVIARPRRGVGETGVSILITDDGRFIETPSRDDTSFPSYIQPNTTSGPPPGLQQATSRRGAGSRSSPHQNSQARR